MHRKFITHSVLLGAFFALLMMLPVGQVFAQGSTTSAITGTVVDEKGQGLPGASVIAIHEPTGSRYGASTRADGRYNIVNMRVGGPYKVTITFIGYKEAVQSGIVLTLASELRQNFKLEVSQAQLEEVKVVASRSSVINSGRTGAATTVSNSSITTLPTLNRSLGDFARLDPRANGLNFAGRNASFNNVTVDGAYFNNAFALSSTIGGQTGASPISIDAIDQFQVLIAPYDVRQGMATGANINVVTKSGTNSWTGSGYYFGTNEGLVGNKIGDATSQFGKFTRGQIGARLGGALIKDKLFVFASFEQETQTDPGSNFVATRTGTEPNKSIAKAEDLDRLKQFLITKYNYDPGAYENYNREKFSQKANIRLDWNISDKHKLNIKYNYLRSFADISPSNSGSLSGGRSPSVNVLPFQGSLYRINNNLDSYIAELNSMFSNSISNNLTVGYTAMRDFRESPVNNTAFPTVDIGNNNLNQMTAFGYEPFSANNLLNSDIFQISDNLTIYRNKNVFTLGVAYESNAFKNGFAPNYFGGYQFRSIDDFIKSASGDLTVSPVRYQVQWSNYAEFPFAEMKGNTFSFYGQDEITAGKGLKLTFGIRGDMTSFPSFDEPKYTNSFVPNLRFRDGVQLATNKFPKTTTLWSPRFGFNWDVKDDKTTQIRGGVGVFSGRVPYVWLSNQLSNNGVLFGSRLVTAAAELRNYPFNPDVNAYKPNPSTLSNLQPTAYNLAVTDQNFKFSQVFRANLAMDKQLGDGWLVSLEGIFTKDINAVYLENVNLPNSTVKAVGADNRVIYYTLGANGLPNSRNERNNQIYGSLRGINAPAAGNSTEFPNISDAILIKNTNLGYSYALTASVSKAFDNGLFASLAYTNSDSRSVNDGGSIAQSQWRDRVVSGDPNENVASYSSYMQAHRFNAYGSYKLNYLNEKAATTFGFTYSVAPAGRFSYTYSGDMNGDNQFSNDLMYVPRGQSEILLRDLGTYTAAQQWADLDKYISQDKYLSSRRGQYAERNGAELPWAANFDFKIIQDFYINVGGKKNTLQFTLDVFNFGNYVSPQWGLNQTPLRAGLLNYVTNDAATGKPVFQFPYRAGTTPLGETFQRSFGLGSRWQAQFGIRYIFN
jgi:hypothetical protein